MKKHPIPSKAHSAIIAVILCFSILGIQSIGLFHGVHHANSGHHLQSQGVFDEIEKAFSPNPQKSNVACKLLDSLLLGASVTTQLIDLGIFESGHLTFIPAVTIILALPKIWSYQSQAPPISNPQF